MDQNNSTPPLQIPYQQLNAETLQAVIESFILREGTDYGIHEAELAQKFSRVLKKIEKEEYVITFDSESETVNILTAEQWKQWQKGSPHEL